MLQEQSNETAIAVLQTNYRHLEKKMDEQHADTKGSIKELKETMDKVLVQMSEQRVNNKMRAAMWATIRHFCTVVVTLVVAHKLKIPVDISGG